MFEVVRSQLGYAKLEDGTILSIRLALGSIKEQARLPVGYNLMVDTSITITAEAPPELKAKTGDKPLPKQNEHLKNFKIWEFIKINETKPSIEEVRYRGSDNLLYRLVYEIEPTVASRTMEYRDQDNNPLYYIRWSEKLSTYIEK